jgi:hypothetical protein
VEIFWNAQEKLLHDEKRYHPHRLAISAPEVSSEGHPAALVNPLSMQVQRTLVKSPPELWAEVSDVETLTRHLAAFGEITITRVEPESTVAWEGERASGTVELTASGWGTKVTLTAQAPDPRAVTPPVPEPGPPAEPGPAASAMEPRESSTIEMAAIAPPPFGETTSPAPARRRWLRFWRRDAEHQTAETVATMPGGPGIPAPAPPAPDPAPPTPGPSPGPPGAPAPDPVPPVPTPSPAPDPGPQIAFDPDGAQALLTRVLDDLGQAHRRPFSQ